MHNNPIGILDSGVGGLSVWQEVVKELPQESILYVGDSANVPYGTKDPETIYQLATRLVDFLLEKDAKLLVVACNSITVTCLDRLRVEYPTIPMIGTVPVVKTAAHLSKTKKIGILSTTRTAQSDYQKDLIEKFATDCVVINHGTDALAPLIDRGITKGDEITNILTEVLAPFQEAGIDTLALGCTHYPFIKSAIQDILGETVTILDSGSAIAHQIRRVLTQNEQLATDDNHPIYDFYTTGEKEAFETFVSSAISVPEERLGVLQSVQL